METLAHTWLVGRPASRDVASAAASMGSDPAARSTRTRPRVALRRPSWSEVNDTSDGMGVWKLT
jgi:hypothetical protein